MPSAPPVSSMTEIPLYSTTTTVKLITGNFQVPTIRMPNAKSSVNPLPTPQKFMS